MSRGLGDVYKRQDKEPADGFDEAEAPAPKKESKPAATAPATAPAEKASGKKFDLDSILG